MQPTVGPGWIVTYSPRRHETAGREIAIPRTVLICDDDALMRGLIRTVLAAEGYELREASNGRQALEELDRGRPDLLILDNRMPGLSGEAVLERVRTDPALSAVRVLLVSGAGMLPELAGTIGADAYLQKPFAVDALRETVERLLGP
jgi:CheY-like chemotaxis protein